MRALRAILLAMLVLSAAAATWAQVPAMAPTPTPEPERLSPEERDRYDRRKTSEQAMERIRTAYARGEYEVVIREVEAALKVDPANQQIRLYGRWAQEKMISREAETESAPITETPVGTGPSALETSSAVAPVGTAASGSVSPLQGLPGAAPVQTPGTETAPQSTATFATPVPPAAPAAMPPASKGLPIQKLVLIIGLVVCLAVAVFVAVSSLMGRRRAANAEAEAPEVPEEPQAPAHAKPGIFAGFTPSAEPVQDEDELAADIASNLGLAPVPTEVAPPPTFDIAGESGESSGAFYETAPTVLESDILETTPISLARSVDSVPTPTPQATPEPEAKPTPPEPAFGPGDTVSFDDLGIVLDSEPANPLIPPKREEPAPPPKQQELAPPPAHEVVDPFDFGLVLSEPGAPSAAPSPTISPAPPSPTETVAKPPAPRVPASEPPKTESGPESINLDDLLFGSFGGGESSGKGNDATVEMKAPETPSVSYDIANPPPALESDDKDLTLGFAGETLHSDDTVKIPSTEMDLPKPASDDPDDGLAETLNMTAVAQPQGVPAGQLAGKSEPDESFYATISTPSSGAQLDERSQRMFEDQYARGKQAYEEKNWKQAVHYLSIAAAIHPENGEVREMLRVSREQKRRQEGHA